MVSSALHGQAGMLHAAVHVHALAVHVHVHVHCMIWHSTSPSLPCNRHHATLMVAHLVCYVPSTPPLTCLPQAGPDFLLLHWPKQLMLALVRGDGACISSHVPSLVGVVEQHPATTWP